jgi:hypothetical protein
MWLTRGLVTLTDTESSSNMKTGKCLDQVNDTKDCIHYS